VWDDHDRPSAVKGSRTVEEVDLIMCWQARRAASVVSLDRSGLMAQLTAPDTWFTELEFKTADADFLVMLTLLRSEGTPVGVSSAARQACVAAAAIAVAHADGREDEGGTSGCALMRSLHWSRLPGWRVSLAVWVMGTTALRRWTK
jgi:hypothetical protein